MQVSFQGWAQRDMPYYTILSTLNKTSHPKTSRRGEVADWGKDAKHFCVCNGIILYVCFNRYNFCQSCFSSSVT